MFRLTNTRQRIIVLLLCLLPLTAQAELRLPALISDNMVLQQHSRARLWGQAEPGSTVVARIANRESRALTDVQGHWEIHLPQLQEGNHTLRIEEQYKTDVLSAVQINDVAVGEVWLASGQSNMEWPVGKSSGAEQVPDLLKDTDLRFFVVSHQTALTPQTDVNGYWVKVTAESAPALSGIGFYFAEQLHRHRGVPVGIIQSAWGSTKAEAWTSLEAIKAEPELQPVLDEIQRQADLPDAEKQAYEQKQLAWEATSYLPDTGITADTQAFSTVGFDDSEWQSVELPALFSDLKFFGDGAIWFRRGFELPDGCCESEILPVPPFAKEGTLQLKQNVIEGSPPLKKGEQGGFKTPPPRYDAVLHLGMVDDFDRVFINGKEIGQTDRNTAHHWLQPRRYQVDADLLKPGQNTIAIRVFDQYGDGGFTGRPQDMFLKTGQQTLPLSGAWKYKVSIDKPAMQADWASVPAPLYGLSNRNTPAVLYNAMIAPLSSYTLQGVIWYQGESDAKQPELYQVLFPTLIRQWRQAWQQNFPFLFVQLANFNLPDDDSQQLWSAMRAIQADTERAVPGTGMVTAIDAGEADSVHPVNKQVVGQRLANLALGTVYGEDVAWRSPECLRTEFADDRSTLVLHCEYAEGLYSKGAISGFEVAGADGQFQAAESVIEGASLRISVDGVDKPAVVRYAWQNNPVANIYNADELPLLPFRLVVGE